MDNYAYLIIDKKTNISAIIDPSEANPIIRRCQELNITPNYIFNTHHHYDHTDANCELKNLYNCKVVAAQSDANRIPCFDIGVEPNQTFALGESLASIIDVSAHTQGHILWYFADDKVLFTGDTLFNLCVGGLFEGTSTEMYNALQKIKSLPDDVNFYPGHEYTIHGLSFAKMYNKNNTDIQEYATYALSRLEQNLPVSPISLGIEKKCNPYLEAKALKELDNLL